MPKNDQNYDLTGIERDLVLQYLMDGNVPVTLTPVSEKENGSERRFRLLFFFA